MNGKNENKSTYGLYLMLLLTIFLLYSSLTINKVTNVTALQIFSFKLTGLSLTLLNTLVIVFPYLVLFWLIISKFYSNYLKNVFSKKYFNYIFILLVATLVLILILYNPNAPAQANPISGSDNSTSSGGLSKSTTTTTTATSNSTQMIINHGSNLLGNINFELIMIIMLFFVTILILLLLVRTKSYFKSSNKDLNANEKEINPAATMDPYKNDIIHEYLKISSILESMGINPDFSLTPIEFDNETKNDLNIREIETITYYYELARFSEEKITEEMYRHFHETLDEIYNAIHKTREQDDTENKG